MQKYLVVFKSGAKVMINIEALYKADYPLNSDYPFAKDAKEDRTIMIHKADVAAFIPESYLAKNQKLE